MAVMRVMPTSEVLHVDDTKPNSGAGATKQGRDRGKMVESKQSSIEVAFVECDNLGAEKEEKCQDICVETEEIIEFPEDSACPTKRQEDIATMVPDDSERSIESPRAQEEHQENTRETVCKEKLRENRSERGHQSVDRKQRYGDRSTVETEDEKRGGSWWKDGGKTILQFFAKILGKRSRMGAKEATNRVSPSGNKRHGQHVKRVSRDDESRKARRRTGVDAGARLKRVSNGYIATHAYRNESRRRNAAENKSRQRWQREEPRSSILRQIQRTRDKNLRVALLEQELRSRLPFAKNVASVTDQALRLGQLSSPLC